MLPHSYGERCLACSTSDQRDEGKYVRCSMEKSKEPRPTEGKPPTAIESVLFMLRSKFPGWICLRGPKNLQSRNLMLHEAAHIITGQGHTLTWMKKYVEIGGDINSDFFSRYKTKYLMGVSNA